MLLSVHGHQLPINAFHGDAGSQSKNQVRVGAQVVCDDPRDQRRRGFFIWLDNDFHSTVKVRTSRTETFSGCTNAWHPVGLALWRCQAEFHAILFGGNEHWMADEFGFERILLVHDGGERECHLAALCGAALQS